MARHCHASPSPTIIKLGLSRVPSRRALVLYETECPAACYGLGVTASGHGEILTVDNTWHHRGSRSLLTFVTGDKQRRRQHFELQHTSHTCRHSSARRWGDYHECDGRKRWRHNREHKSLQMRVDRTSSKGRTNRSRTPRAVDTMSRRDTLARGHACMQTSSEYHEQQYYLFVNVHAFIFVIYLLQPCGTPCAAGTLLSYTSTTATESAVLFIC
jgi:hypothetical protein